MLFCELFLFLHSCLFPIFLQVCRPLPPGGNTVAGNKYHIIYELYNMHLVCNIKDIFAICNVILINSFGKPIHPNAKFSLCNCGLSRGAFKFLEIFSL